MPGWETPQNQLTTLPLRNPHWISLAGTKGLEPAPFWLTTRCSTFRTAFYRIPNQVPECREGKSLPGITPLKKILLASATGLEPAPFWLTTRDSTFELDARRMSGGKSPRSLHPSKNSLLNLDLFDLFNCCTSVFNRMQDVEDLVRPSTDHRHITSQCV